MPPVADELQQLVAELLELVSLLDLKARSSFLNRCQGGSHLANWTDLVPRELRG